MSPGPNNIVLGEGGVHKKCKDEEVKMNMVFNKFLEVPQGLLVSIVPGL